MPTKKPDTPEDGTLDTATVAEAASATPEASEGVSTASAAPADAAATPAAAPVAAAPSNEERAKALVKSYLGWSGVAGLIPVPAADVVAITALQLRLISGIADIYGVPFKQNAAKSILTSLLGSIVPTSTASVVSSLVKAVPGIGTLFGVATLPAFAAASTYAVGKVFIAHFEAGGTLLDFEPAKFRAYFVSEFEKAKGKEATPAAS